MPICSEKWTDILVVIVLLLTSTFLRENGSMEEDDSDNPWDDTLLIQAYDRAVNLAKTNLQKNVLNQNETKAQKNDKGTESLKEPFSKFKEPSSNSAAVPKGNQWTVGCKCRAVWSQDGLEYEAEIINIRGNRNQARVKFIGYNNEENVKISSLKPSQGDTARQKQISDSQYDMEESAFIPSSPLQNIPSQVDEGIMFPPPPPPHVISYLPKDEQEALSAMLMSWYMSGYHTGYYQGLQAARTTPNKKK